MLTTRVEKAWEKKRRHPTQKMMDNHIEATKDAFAFVHLLDLVEHMSEEIYQLRMEVQTMEQDDDGSSLDWTAPVGGKKNYMN